MIRIIPYLKAFPPEIADSIRAAEKFDFGQLVLEPHPNNPEAHKLPQLNSIEWEMFNTGLLRLPAPLCWFEFSVNDEPAEAGILAEDDGQALKIRILSLMPIIEGQRMTPFDLPVNYSPIYILVRDPACSSPTPGRERPVLVEYDSHEQQLLFQYYDRELRNFGMDVFLTVYFALMLVSKTTKIEHKPAPKFINSKRIKRKEEPLPAHRIVRIVPWKYISESQKEAGRTHASPRLHWRNSHIRVVDHRTPKAIHIEGRGWCIPIPRCLVGSKENGEVSHEYFYVGDQKDLTKA